MLSTLDTNIQNVGSQSINQERFGDLQRLEELAGLVLVHKAHHIEAEIGDTLHGKVCTKKRRAEDRKVLGELGGTGSEHKASPSG